MVIRRLGQFGQQGVSSSQAAAHRRTSNETAALPLLAQGRAVTFIES